MYPAYSAQHTSCQPIPSSSFGEGVHGLHALRCTVDVLALMFGCCMHAHAGKRGSKQRRKSPSATFARS